MNRHGRPTVPSATAGALVMQATSTGNYGLDHEEALIFETGSFAATGVDWPDVEINGDHLGDLGRSEEIGLPGLSEPEVMRHYVRLSRMNYAIDAGIYPLGSCTMKYNPRLGERIARFPGLADIHPLQPISTVQGALGVMEELGHWLMELTGMPGIALSPKAGAHGELCGMKSIRAALEDQGNPREVVLVPESAHGTNPSTAALCGYRVESVACDDSGRIDMASFRAKLNPNVAAIMVTNPNTCGLFETDIQEIAEAIHRIGAFVYCDGANFNALVGRIRPGDLGIDAMHINLHKTFSTPHGGGGPGSGPVVFSKALTPYAPVPLVVKGDEGQLDIEEHVGSSKAFGRITAFHGQMGMFTRALAYMRSLGTDGLLQVAEDAVLNANYVLVELSSAMVPAYAGTCMHEALFDDAFLKDSGVSTLDFAKAMIDEGFHPMTMYFPLVVEGALLIEPTETESKASLDEFIASLLSLVAEAKSGNKERFEGAPFYAPRRRLDETQAARNPVLRWSGAEKDATK